MEEEKIWKKQAELDMKAAQDSVLSGNYEWASFQAHQAVEKSLKALYIKKNKLLLKTHDIVLLAKRLDAPKKILENCSKINPSYLDTRYPDIPKEYAKENAEELIALAKEVIEWTNKNL